MKKVSNVFGLLLVAAATLSAQGTINIVANAGNRLAPGFPGAGVAQGAIFAVSGVNVGSDPFTQATFPLPTTDGLNGVTVQVSVGGTSVDCILVYVSSSEVGAILPSNTPVGTGTVTVNNNGQTATSAITVVPAAFGIFTQSQTGQGPALAFNVAGDGSSTLNTLTAPASAGQTMMLNGTGLGAIASDETQSGVTDTPGSTPQVWVGTQQAQVISASRGTCCSGVDPSFQVPQAVAGWDVIQFTVPSGITGCHVPVAVQVGDKVSNFSTISVSNGGPCSDPTGPFNAAFIQNLAGTSASVASINLSRASTKISAAGVTVTSSADQGSANFFSYDLTALQASPQAFTGVTAIGSCYVILNYLNPQITPIGNLPSGLDAGKVINVTGPNGTKQMTPVEKQTGSYLGNFGTSMTLPSIPGFPGGLPGGIPGLPGATQPYLEAGNYTVDNGAGGADVGHFSASLTLKTPLTWTNQDALTQVNRSQGVQVTWSGGDPAGTVTISGGVVYVSSASSYSGTFVCMAPVSAGQFTVPSIVTLSLPASTSISGPAGSPATPTGSLSVGATVTGTFTAPNITIGTISSTVLALKNLSYI